MARSQIIKDIANGNVTLETTMTRLKIILSEFNKPELTVWVDNELSGYSDDSPFPSYRRLGASRAYAKIDGVEMGMYFTNKEMSLDFLLEGINKNSSERSIPLSLSALENATDGAHFVHYLPTHWVEKFIQGLIHVKTACIDYGEVKSIAQTVLAAVKQRTLDILLLLEKEFGNLDEFDIPVEAKSQNELDDITNKIYKIIGVGDMNITVNNNGGNPQNNFADENAVINVTQKNGVDTAQLTELLNAVRRESFELTSEDTKNVTEQLDVIESELAQALPRKNFLKTALTGLQAIKGTAEFGAAVVALVQFFQSLLI